jgi:hypothetical protein
MPAGKLVDELGAEEFARRQGARLGGARQFYRERWRRDGGEVLELIDRRSRRPRGKRGIELETEVQIVGEEA